MLRQDQYRPMHMAGYTRKPKADICVPTMCNYWQVVSKRGGWGERPPQEWGGWGGLSGGRNREESDAASRVRVPYQSSR